METMHGSKPYTRANGARWAAAMGLFVVLWALAASGARAQQVHEESLEQATGAGTIAYARAMYEMTAHNEQILAQMDRQAAAARFRRNVFGAFVLAGAIYFILRFRKPKGTGATGANEGKKTSGSTTPPAGTP